MHVYPGIDSTDLFRALQRCMNDRQPCRMQHRFDYGDGSSAWFDLSIQPGPDGIFLISADITERKRAEVHYRGMPIASRCSPTPRAPWPRPARKSAR
jgi:hypothetical protein